METTFAQNNGKSACGLRYTTRLKPNLVFFVFWNATDQLNIIRDRYSTNDDNSQHSSVLARGPASWRAFDTLLCWITYAMILNASLWILN